MPSGDDTARRSAVTIGDNVGSGVSRCADRATIDYDSVSGKTVRSGRRLRVLLISYWFPPSNVIGAIRVGHFAKSLLEAGHDVRVLAGENSDDQSLPVPFPADRVIHVQARRRGESLGSIVRVLRRSAPGVTPGFEPPQVASGSASPSPALGGSAEAKLLRLAAHP